MISRLVYSLGRFPVTRYPVQSSRFLSCSQALWSADKSTAEPLKAVVKATTNNGGMLNLLRAKTGVTGPWMLGTGVAAICLSKEIYIVTAETPIVIVFGVMLVIMMKKLGKPVADYLDSKSQVTQSSKHH